MRRSDRAGQGPLNTYRVLLGRPPRRHYPGLNRGLLALATPAFTNVTGIETLKIGGAADNAVTLGAKASADVGGVGHTFTLDDSAGLGGLMLDGSAMTADLKVLAGAGTDAIVGGSRNDTFFASLGNDIFTGGAGNNTFAFNSPNLGSDRITDFNNTTRADQIQVSAAGFGGGLTVNQDVTSAFGTSANANFGTTSERFHFDTANQTLYYSATGSGGTAIAIAQIEAGVTLHPHDIHVAAYAIFFGGTRSKRGRRLRRARLMYWLPGPDRQD